MHSAFLPMRCVPVKRRCRATGVTVAQSTSVMRQPRLGRLLAATHLAVLGAALGVAGAILVATSGHLARPGAYGLFIANLVVGQFLVAFYWLRQRPGERTGLLLVALGYANLGMALQGASSGLLRSIGLLFEPLVVTLGFYVVFAFPTGRLTHRLDRIVMAATAVIAFWGTIPFLLFVPVAWGAIHLGACNTACPDNALMIADRPALASASLGPGFDAAAAAVTIAIAGILLFRLVNASPPRRRMLASIYAPALLLALVIATYEAAALELVKLDAGSYRALAWALAIAHSAWAYGFLLALLLAGVFAGIALKQMLAKLGPETSAAALRSVVADALHDPSLELGFRISSDGGDSSFVDPTGRWIVPADVGPGRMATPVEKDGQTLAVIVHDDSLNRDPELVRSAGRVLQLAVYNDRLERDLESAVTELRASRSRIASARDAERRRIERDLHDGAQQRLVALRIGLGLLSESVHSDPENVAAKLGELGSDVEAALEEVRALAHGVYPALLANMGLERALRALGRSAPVATTVKAVGLGRYPPEIESAVYFCCAEALQNVAKHALDARSASISLAANGTLDFEVRDDGDGFAEEETRAGAGFINMRDRLAVVGGTLEVQSRPGAGTNVRGTVPLPISTRRGSLSA
jgi:signal transduction histidine kinase